MKKINFACFSIVLGLALFLLPGRGHAQSAADLSKKLELLKAYPELIVVNGKIATIGPMDTQLTEVQAMAVKNNRILALGTNDQIRFLAGPNTEVLDAKGRRVLPGLIDGHTHPWRFAVEHWMGEEGDFIAKRYNDPQLRIVFAKGNNAVEVLRSVEQRVRERAQELGPGKWIWVKLFARDSLPASREIVNPLFEQAAGTPGTITREFLDALAPNNPLIVYSSEAIGPSTHNTRAKEEMIKFLGEEEFGLTARTAVFYDIFLHGRMEETLDFLKRELLTCVLGQGITTFGNHYAGTPSIMKTFRLLYERGELSARWAFWLNAPSGAPGGNTRGEAGDVVTSFYRNLGDFRRIGNDYIWSAGVSNEGWENGLICTTAKPRDPNTPKMPRTAGDLQLGPRPDCSDPIDFNAQRGYRTVKTALEAGLRIGFMHAYSDGTYDALFHMIEEAIAEGKITLEEVRALRISLEHNPIIRPDQIQKMAKYNLMPAFNGYQVQGNIKGGAFLKTYGEQHMNWMAPMKSLADAGGHPVFNTDAHMFKSTPENMRMDYPPGDPADPRTSWNGNIWAFVEFFATRYMHHDRITYNLNEAVDKVTLLKAGTLWGAEQLLNEKNIRSLEVGKLADFIVLDKDYFTIPADQIHTINTLLTATGGKVVFKDNSY